MWNRDEGVEKKGTKEQDGGKLSIEMVLLLLLLMLMVTTIIVIYVQTWALGLSRQCWRGAQETERVTGCNVPRNW